MSKQKDLGFWYWVFWIAVIATALWVMAKLLGIIRTTIILDIFPIASGIIAMVGIGITLGNYFQKTNFTFDKINKIESRQNRMVHGLIKVEKDISMVKNDINVMKGDISAIKKDINTIKKKIK